MKFINKWNYIFFLTLFILSSCSLGRSSQSSQCIPIRVGIILASEDSEKGLEQKKGYEMALAEIQADGGIQGCPIELVYENEGEELDTQSAQVAIMQLAEQNVLAIIGGTTNEATLNAATVAGYFKVPLIIPSSTDDEITNVGNQWIFRLRASNESDANTVFEMVRLGFGPEANIVILYEETDFGESTAVVTASTIMSIGLNIAGYYSYSNQDSDFSSIIEEVNTTAPEVVYVISSDSEVAANLYSLFKADQVSYNLMIGDGPGFTERSFLYDGNQQIYENLNNLVIVSDWSLDLPWTGMDKFVQDFSSFSQQNNYNYSVPVLRNVESYTSLKLLSNALSQVTFPEQKGRNIQELSADDLKSVRESLASELRNLDTANKDSLFGTVSFDGTGQNRQTPILVQVLNGEIVTIYPPRYAQESPVFNLGW